MPWPRAGLPVTPSRSRSLRRLAAFALCLLCAVGGEREAPADEPGRQELFDASDFRLRVSAALVLGRTKPAGARADLEKALGDAHPAVRIAAAGALVSLGDAAAAPALDRAAAKEGALSVKTRFQECAAQLRRGPSAGAPGAAPPSLDGKRFVLELGTMRNNTPIRGDQMNQVLRDSARSHAGRIRGAFVLDAHDAQLISRAGEKKIPVLLIDGQLSRLSQTQRPDGTVTLSAQVEFSLRRIPEQVLRGTLSGGASAQDSVRVLGNQARLNELQKQVIEGAVESAMRNADGGLAMAASK